MTSSNTELTVTLPVPEAAELASIAAKLGVSTQKLLGYHVLKSAYGSSHPEAIVFERSIARGEVGQ